MQIDKACYRDGTGTYLSQTNEVATFSCVRLYLYRDTMSGVLWDIPSRADGGRPMKYRMIARRLKQSRNLSITLRLETTKLQP